MIVQLGAPARPVQQVRELHPAPVSVLPTTPALRRLPPQLQPPRTSTLSCVAELAPLRPPELAEPAHRAPGLNIAGRPPSPPQTIASPPAPCPPPALRPAPSLPRLPTPSSLSPQPATPPRLHHVEAVATHLQPHPLSRPWSIPSPPSVTTESRPLQPQLSRPWGRQPTPPRVPPATSPRAAPPSTDSDSSGDETNERYGVTTATNRRRKRLAEDILATCKNKRPITAPELRAWASKFSPGTRHSYLVTVIPELGRRQVKLTGDVKGVVREAKLALTAHRPVQAPPLNATLVRETTAAISDPELHAVIVLMWKTASRLTSISQLETADVKEVPSLYSTVSMTFRRGKTILATGPHTLWAEVDQSTLSFIRRRRSQNAQNLFSRTAEQLYRPIRAAFPGYQVRSFRRGALQELAATGATLEELRIVSRHMTDASLYRYLNFGEESHAERDKVLRLTHRL